MKRTRKGLIPFILLCCFHLPASAAAQNKTPGLPLEPERTIAFETSEGTWMSVDVSPDGQTLVFDLLGDLYLLGIDGGEARAITRGLAFDTQPVFSPDGREILFVSDRSGAENFWAVTVDGNRMRQLTFSSDLRLFASPSWSADGRHIFGSVYRADLAAFELWSFDPEGQGKLLIPVKSAPDQPRSAWSSVLGVRPSPGGSSIYYAQLTGGQDADVPGWVVRRMELDSGESEALVEPVVNRGQSYGSYFRPLPSPDGRLLAYASRHRGQTGLRLLDLDSGADRWLVYPVQRDQIQAVGAQDLMPGYAFTPDGRCLIYTHENRLWKLTLADGEITEIPFSAQVNLSLGPPVRADILEEGGPVRARLIQTPAPSPDGRRLAFSALGRIYVQELGAASPPTPLVDLPPGQFHPSWSPDGRSLVFVTWTAADAGQVWIAAADGSGAPQRLTQQADFYTRPAFTPDGDSVLVQHSSHYERMHRYMEYGAVRDAALLRLPLSGARDSTELTRGEIGGRMHFLADGAEVAVNFEDGLRAVSLTTGEQRPLVSAVGRGWYFVEGPQAIQELQVSPDGRWLLARSFAQQLHLLPLAGEREEGSFLAVDLSDPSTVQQQVTRSGADFFSWADGGHTLTWAVGSTWYRCRLEPANDEAGEATQPERVCRSPESFEITVELPRDTPEGYLVLRGATVFTMNGDELVGDADLHIRDNRVVAVVPRGQRDVPADARIVVLDGQYIVPGFIDTHTHLADIRRDLIEFASWGAAANLAYGVTTVFDPSTLSIDMLVYQDLVDAGLIVGSRIRSTATAIFSFHDFRSLEQIENVLLRYRDHYRTRNVKMYRSGDRQVRQWFAMAARKLGMQPTTEGAMVMKLMLTQLLDGYTGLEHEFPAQPLGRDVVELVAQSGAAYTLTLILSAGPDSENWFIGRDDPATLPKMQRFWPGFARDLKLRRADWHTFEEYSFPAAAAGAAEIQRAGGTIGVGAHGNVPGIGYHWEMQTLATGGMTPLEILRAATLGSARTIGRQAELGSLEAGKFADLVVLDRDPREDIANTLSIRYVMKNGRLYDGASLDEIWPRQRPFPRPWYAKEEIE